MTSPRKSRPMSMKAAGRLGGIAYGKSTTAERRREISRLGGLKRAANSPLCKHPRKAIAKDRFLDWEVQKCNCGMRRCRKYGKPWSRWRRRRPYRRLR